MYEDQLRRIIHDCESDRVEFTVAVRDMDKFCEAACAFANDLPNSKRPGYLLIGVADDRRIVGLTVSDELLRNLAGIRENGNVQPLPSIKVDKVVTSDGEVAVVTVEPALLPPVRYRGRTYIRLGPRKGIATLQDEKKLTERRVSQARTFDAEPCLGSSLCDLSLPIFKIEYQPIAVDPETLAENQRSIEQQLASLRFFALDLQIPTNAGIVLFGSDVRNFMSGAYIQFLRINGTTLDDDVEQDRELVGDLLSMLRELDAIISANISRAPSELKGLREEMVATYPAVAIREMLLNGIMHRDYNSTAPLRFTWFADRIEIQSPGGLYGEATRGNFPAQTSYRNPVVAEALKTLGYVNRYGRGVIRTREAMRKNGNPPPEFTFEDNFVLVTLRTSQ